MKIKKIIVNEKPKSCKECLFHGCDFMDCDMFGGECPLCEEKDRYTNNSQKVDHRLIKEQNNEIN